MLPAEEWHKLYKDGFLGIIVGELLGEGMTRYVYACNVKIDGHEVVIKIETGHGFFQNAVEYRMWEYLKDEKIAQWLAPCLHISTCGKVLIQRRTQPMRDEEYPVMIPNMFTDQKKGNFGLLDGRPVCHDYGMMPLPPLNVIKDARLKKADPWHHRK